MSGAWTDPKTWGSVVLPSAEMNTYVRDNENYLKTHIALEAAVELTIATGSITITQAYHDVDTEGDDPTDNLDTIAVPAGTGEGMIIFLRAEDAAHVVTLRHGIGNLRLGVDIVLDDTEKHVVLIKGPTNWYLIGLYYPTKEFTANAFQYPAPGTDWTPQLEGAGLPQELNNKTVFLPLNFLKIGDAIISYKLVGDAVKADSITLDCKLVRINKADPLTHTDIPGGNIAQVVLDGNFDVEAVLTDPEVVATDKQYVLEILGTTGNTDAITVMGAEVKIRRLD